MTGLRQALATAFILCAFSLIIESRKLSRIIAAAALIVLATSFHAIAGVAWIPFIMWMWPKRRIVNLLTPVNVLKWGIAISVGAFVLYPFVMRLAGNFFPQYVNYFSGTWSDSNYFASLFKTLIQVVFLIVGVIYIRNKEELSDIDKLSLLMVAFSVIVCTLAMRMEIWSRLSAVFSIFTALTWAPSFVYGETNRRNRFILKLSIFGFSLAYMIITFIFRPEWDGVVPYMFMN